MYSGAGYAKNGYDVNMKNAYDALVAAEAGKKLPAP